MSDPIGSRQAFETLAGGGYVLTLLDEGVRVEVRHVRRRGPELHGEVEVWCDWAGVHTFGGTGSLSCADMNLSSQPAREARARYCSARARSRPQDFDWIGAIDAVCRRVIAADRGGCEAIVLDDAGENGPPQDFLVHGLKIPSDSHSQLICDGGGMKSLIMLLVLGSMAQSDIPTLYLDWEWTADRHKARKQRLFGPERLEHLHYLGCQNSIVVEQDRIRRICDQHQIQFIAIDSIGAACEGKLADDDVARAYNRVLRNLPPGLAGAHIPKGVVEPGVDLKAFGSAFFNNFTRMSWSVRKQAGADENIVTAMLSPSKQNDGARLPPTAIEFTFSDERIEVRGVDPVTVDGLSQSLPLWRRIAHHIKTGGGVPLTIAALAEALEAKPDSIKKAISPRRASGKSMFCQVPGADGVVRIALVDRRAA